MKKGQDVGITIGPLYLVHHNIPGKRVRRFISKSHMLFLPISGQVTLTIGETTFVAAPGRAIYVPPNTPHALRATKLQGERFIAMTDADYWRNQCGDRAVPPKLIFDIDLLRAVLSRLRQTQSKKNSSLYVRTFVRALHESLCEQGQYGFHSRAIAKDSRVASVFELMEDDVTGTIASYAKQCGLGERNLHRLFVKNLGMSPKEVLLELRLAQAEKMLKAGSSVTSVALELGYASLSQFISIFRKKRGFSPSFTRKIDV